MAELHCSGWWEETGFGRQPMNNLKLSFSDGRIFGKGADVVGDFEMDGQLEGDRIYLRKQYIGQHSIEYHGMSVGEGAYTGTWSYCGYLGGRWFLGIVRSAVAAAVREIDQTVEP